MKSLPNSCCVHRESIIFSKVTVSFDSFFIPLTEEYEERSMIEPSQHEKWEFQELVKILVNWINDELRCVCFMRNALGLPRLYKLYMRSLRV